MSILDKPKNIKINFIIGSGRSGTTLLLYILNNHKNCVSTPEWKHLLFFYKKYHDMTEATPELLKDLEWYNKIMQKSDDSSDYYNYSTQKFTIPTHLGEKLNYFELCKRIYFSFADNKANLNTIIDKNPLYTLYVNKLVSIFPDAKFLCTVRDYRSYVLSNIQSEDFNKQKTSVQYHALVWLFYNKLILNITSKYKNKTKILKYEDLVSDQEKMFLEICTFFDIEPNLSSLDFQNTIQPQKDITLLHQRIAKRMSDLSKPINTERTESWKGVLSPFQLKIIEFWCAKTGKKFGYLPTQKINFFEKISILFLSTPYYGRVFIYFKLKSVRLNFYLNDMKRAKYFDLQKTTNQ